MFKKKKKEQDSTKCLKYVVYIDLECTPVISVLTRPTQEDY